LKEDAEAQGAGFLFDFEVARADVEKEKVILSSTDGKTVEARFVVNCAGGDSVDIAHFFGLGLEYTDLHFRGEYWEIKPEFARRVNRNIHPVPKHSDLPFLGPHWVARSDGRREIGPNVVLVAGSKTYEGFFDSVGQAVAKVLERPFLNKLKLGLNPEFWQLAIEEWHTSISRRAMVERIQPFLPWLKVEHLACRGTAGVRSSIVDPDGRFPREAIEIADPRSYHVINYNSPGASGGPAFAVHLLDRIEAHGGLSCLKAKPNPPKTFWDYKKILDQL
jgi:L-2-hydroxyglutarate oxidase